MGKTVVLGASPNPNRYAHRAIQQLVLHDQEVVAVGLRKGEVAGVEIQTDRPIVSDVDTLTLYVGPRNQASWYEYIFDLNPRRIIFNPGTENPELIKKVKEKGIKAELACTLVMLSVGNY